jgi:TolA-binding protein
VKKDPVKKDPVKKDPVKKDPVVVKKPPPKDPPPDTPKMTWRDYYKKAARAGAGKLAVYQEAASKGHAVAYYYIGRTLMTSGKKGAAIKAFKTFIRKRPGDAKADTARDFIAQMGG